MLESHLKGLTTNKDKIESIQILCLVLKAGLLLWSCVCVYSLHFLFGFAPEIEGQEKMWLMTMIKEIGK